ncbi:acyl-CoA N-acyltransferase [Macroventuria anomochaeta]|uniref:Acyl-CoA N-acyltransferase n=1 Tax=Macroventuria anomochaeta TaxID=301207 RepID=A0ACB6SEP8_9PLEO|nr:acyl-CoA N-acyltransferase [Macroventuria anomochaeta]KAF2631567.1 acyl-CoA N-acyltransferase [Macroventuria anomochaeta]
MLDPNFHITTPRLYLSYLNPSNDAHMSFMVRLVNSPEIVAVVAQTHAKSPPPPQSVSEARLAMASAAERLEKTGSGRYIISLRTPDTDFTDESGDREYLGIVSMQLKRFPDIECPKIPDIGFLLLSEYHGKGYASEACNALMQHFKETRGHERFAGFTHPENVNSQRLFRRLGFEDRGTMDVAGVIWGNSSAARVAVWVKGVSPDTDLGDLGIGPGLGEASNMGSVVNKLVG